jgi:hypothetical protein
MDIIQYVSAYLEHTRIYEIKSKVRSVDDHGVDIVAVSPKTKVRLNVEAKGQTSTKNWSNRFGKEFDRNQKRDHLGKALLKCCEYIEKNEAAAIALPRDSVNKELIDSIRSTIRRLGIVVFLVDQKGIVQLAVGNLPS